MYLNFGIAQINPRLGDFEANFEKILSFISLLEKKSHFIIFPAYALTGAPLEGLWRRNNFLKKPKNIMKKF